MSQSPGIVIGFDGSLVAFGWAVVELAAVPHVVAAGCIRTAPDPRSRHTYQADQDGARVDVIAHALLRVLDEAMRPGVPVLVAIEAPAGAQHAASAKALGLAYGVSRAVCAARGISPITVQAHEVKLVCGGSKSASKGDVADGVCGLVGWFSSAKTKEAREGESDAVGVALTAMRHPVCVALRGAA
jgi:Holliday junction resolvasome RuvABC endonuclease subunit